MNDFTDLFASTEQSYGLPTGFLGRVAQIESSMNPRAQNPRTSAGGLFQFIDSTASKYGLRDRFDPAQATDAAARLARDNANRLRNALGRDPTAGELYLAHQQGGGGAARLLANPSARAADIVGARAVTLNGGTPDMTAGQFAQRWVGRVDGAQAPRQTAPQMLGYAATPRPSPAIAAIAQATGGQPSAPQGQAMSDTAAAEKPAPSTIGGLGGLGGFQPIAGGKFGDLLQVIGMALLSSPGSAPLQNLPALQMAMAGRRDQAEERQRAQANLDREFGRSVQNDARAASQFDRTLAVQQQQANRREAVQLQPIMDGARNIIGTFNPLTGEQRPATPLGAASAPSSAPAPAGATPAPSPQAPTTPLPGQATTTAPAPPQAPAPQVNAFGVPIIQGMRTLVDPAERARYGIPADDRRVYQIDAAGKITSPGGQTVNVNPAERSYDAARGKQDADRFGEIQTAGRSAQTQIATLNLMERLTNDQNFYSGTGAQTALQVKRFMTGLGMAEGAAASPMELFQALSNKVTLAGIGGSLGTAISNADRDFIQQINPNLANTPEGNRQLIRIARSLAQREQQIAQMAREYQRRNGGRLDSGFDEEMQRWADANPLFPQAQGQTSGQGTPGAATPQPPAAAPRITSEAEFRALPSGSTFTAPDGSVRRKP